MFSADNSVLIFIDVQGKLAQMMSEKEKLFKNLHSLLRAVQILEIPIIHTEQAPDKIGATIPEFAELFASPPITKSSFSCCGEKAFVEKLDQLKRREIIIAGIEAHVCVYQTTVDLLAAEHDVQVVADAVSSRHAENKTYALEKMKAAGAVLTTTEMMICELMKTSRHPKFREIMKLIK